MNRMITLILIFHKTVFLHIRFSKQLFQRFIRIIPLTISSALYCAIFIRLTLDLFDVPAEISKIIREYSVTSNPLQHNRCREI